MPATPLILGELGLCLGPFYSLLPCSPWKQEHCGVSLLVFSMIQCHEWDISMVLVPDTVTKIVQGLGLFWSFFFFPVPLFSTLPVQFSLVQGGWMASSEIAHSPTLRRIHTLPPGIPEEIYSISLECDCLVPCQFIISYKCTLQLIY